MKLIAIPIHVLFLAVALLIGCDNSESAPDADLAAESRVKMPPADEAERLATLHAAMDEAIALLEAGENKRFYTEFIDPFFMARGLAGSETSVAESIARLDTDPEATDWMKEYAELFLENLNDYRQRAPTWMLDGRVAHFLSSPNEDSHFGEFWVWLDGRWMISPET